jgi:U3 small nucleolar RNA-associated protein 7
VYAKPAIQTPLAGSAPPPLYLTHAVPARPLSGLRFCPFTDVLSVAHARGLSSVLVPGAGEPHFDSAEADPFERRAMRREREVRGLLDKIAPDMIALDPAFVGGLAPPPAPAPDVPFARLPRLERLRVQGKADEREEDADGDAEMGDVMEEGNHAPSRAEKEKHKMRGKGKSLKRSAPRPPLPSAPAHARTGICASSGRTSSTRARCAPSRVCVCIR